MTKTSKNIKRIFSLLAIVIILSSIITIPAHATYTPFWQRSRAFVAAALTAINIVAESATMDTASIVEYIADPMEVQYTYLDAWQDRPEIQIYPDYTVIDGQEYTDIWISNEAAEKFRVDAWDFKTAYNIASQSNGTFAQGVGEYDGLPVFNVGNEYITQSIEYPYQSGNFDFGNNGRVQISNSTDGKTAYLYYTYGSQIAYNRPELNFPIKLRGRYANNDINVQYQYNNWSTWSNLTKSPGWPTFVSQPFSYDYVAQTIPANEQLPSDVGMMIRVPSDDGNGNRYFDTWLHDNPEFDQGEPVTIDVNLDPTIETKLDDLLDIIIPIIPMINNNLGGVTFVENHTEPVPQPDTLLPNTYWSQLENKLDQIRQTIQNLNPDFSQIIQAIQTIPSAITQAVTNITQPIVQAINRACLYIL